MGIGVPKTAKAFIGTCELRIGELTEAGLLTADHSVGYIDNVKLDIQSNMADLRAGHPLSLFDSATTNTVTGFTGTLQEFSRRNLNFLVSNRIANYDALSTEVGGDIANVSSDLPIGKHTGFHLTGPTGFTLVPGDTVVIYQPSDPGKLSVCVVDAFTAPVSPEEYAVVDMDDRYPLVGPGTDTLAFSSGASVKWFKSLPVEIGVSIYRPQYYSVQLIQLNRPIGKPMTWLFWKNFIVPSLSVEFKASDWSKFGLQVKCLRPYLSDYLEIGSPLHHLVSRISYRPIFEVLDLSDNTTVENPLLDLAGISGSVYGDSSVTGDITVEAGFSGAVSGDSIITGTVSIGAGMAGDVSGDSIITGNASISAGLAGDVSGDSTVTGDLTTGAGGSRYFRLNINEPFSGSVVEAQFRVAKSGTRYPSDMSSDSQPPLEASASDIYLGHSAWFAFDSDTTTHWTASYTAGWVQIDLGTAITPDYLYLTGNGNNGPRVWQLLGSNTGSFTGEEVTYLSVTESIQWGLFEERAYPIP
ncbi:bactofilin family protein [Methylovulum miyakonense]|uniref:polymer-forming cytoskeletal protein n=1 Tax=Methylovulum miyakonense TaxID=645578 RepID=UPI000369B7A9|nr:polymer-forming cytoskeletal protein [Methylovulum miyakonense]